MQTLKSAVKWLFALSDGHFVLLFGMLIASAVGVVLNMPHAYGAAATLTPLVLLKLKS